MSRHYPKLRSPYHGEKSSTSALVVIRFFMRHVHQEVRTEVVRAMDTFMELIKPNRLVTFFDEHGYGYSGLDSEWPDIRERTLEPAGDQYLIVRLGGAKWVGDYALEYYGVPDITPPDKLDERASRILFHVPLELLEEKGPGSIRALAMTLAEGLPFCSGYVDLSYSDVGLIWATQPEQEVMRRYPGMHIENNGGRSGVGVKLDGVHWMNFLGQPVLGQLGGVEGLRRKLTQPGITLEELGRDRALVTLGEWPEVGDVDAGETLPLHRALARVVEPYLFHKTYGRAGQVHPFDEIFMRWERRFLD